MIRLEHPSLDPLVLDDWNKGYIVEVLDIGMPQVREVVDARPRADGIYDQTGHVGARAVAVTVHLTPCDSETVDQKRSRIAAFLHPRIRPTMTFSRDGEEPRQLTLRGGDLQAPRSNPRYEVVQASWVSDGPILSGTPHGAVLLPAGNAPGRSYDLVRPRSYPPHSGGPSLLLNNGNTSASWVAAIFGPCTSPRIVNRTTEAELSFPGLSIAAGSFLWVDSAARSVTVEQSPDASRYSYLDFVSSSWWDLPPGASMVEFTAETSAPPASAWLEWRDAWII